MRILIALTRILVFFYKLVTESISRLFGLFHAQNTCPDTFHDFEQLPMVPLERVFQHSNVRELLLLAFIKPEIERAIQNSSLGTFQYSFRAERPQIVEMRLIPKIEHKKLSSCSPSDNEATIVLRRIKGEKDLRLWNEMELVKNSEGLEIYMKLPPDPSSTVTYYTHFDVRNMFPRLRNYLFTLFRPSDDAHLLLDFRTVSIHNSSIFALEPFIQHGKYITISSIFPLESEHLCALFGHLKDVVKLRIDGPVLGDLQWLSNIRCVNIHLIHATWLQVDLLKGLKTPAVLASHVNWTSTDVERLIMMWRNQELPKEQFVVAVSTRRSCELSEEQLEHFDPRPSVLKRYPFAINSVSVSRLPKLVNMRESVDIRRPGDQRICTISFWSHGLLFLSWTLPDDI